jgi:hypothetical protein
MAISAMGVVQNLPNACHHLPAESSAEQRQSFGGGSGAWHCYTLLVKAKEY